MTSYSNTDDYIAGFPEPVQSKLNQIRTRIRGIAPDAEECISYGIPTFKYLGKPLIYFAGFSKHISLYPAPRSHQDFAESLAPYKGGAGTVQFPLTKELPLELIDRIVSFRLGELKDAKKKA